MWKAQQIELSAYPQKKDELGEKTAPPEQTDKKLRGYRILEDLRIYPSIVCLERIRSSEV